MVFMRSFRVISQAGAKDTAATLMQKSEPFLGGGAIMRHKKPASLNIGIDKDPRCGGIRLYQ